MATVSEMLAIAIEHHQAGQLAEAEQLYRQILRMEPDCADALQRLGALAHQAGQPALAVDYLRRAVAISPQVAGYQYNLSVAYEALRRPLEAAACAGRALELEPDFAEAHYQLGNLLRIQGQLAQAIACYRRAIALRPEYVEAYHNWGLALYDAGQLDLARRCYQKTLELRPDYALAHYNLGSALIDQGQATEGIACYQRAVALSPGYRQAHSNLLCALYLDPTRDARAIYEEHRRWNRQHAAPLARLIEPCGNDRSPDRRLRIGYVSPDLCGHAVGQFLLPLWESHDREQVEVVGYASVEKADALTERCRAHCDVWRDVRDCSDEQLVQAIRGDRIDILVDLTLHMAGNRLLVFARKPAPVQVTYLGYCGTTGLTTIDYRVTDPYLDPPGGDEFFSEQPLRLPESYWCYRPVAETPPPVAPPALRAGQVTFGCLNNFCKASPASLDAWCRLLQSLPESRLLLHARPGSHRARVWELAARQGVAPARVSFVDRVPTTEYFRLYQQIDVALDPFPYGGGTTTCDALWMGVPVVSLAGRMAVGRGGLSILSNVGLADLVADDCPQYVRIAAALARDLPRLARLRAALRGRMQGSPLMDAPRFARNVEAAYRTIWRRWCGEAG
jgi:predicted O-linked N-acetylglucosamine transferase (SPINDLY family)